MKINTISILILVIILSGCIGKQDKNMNLSKDISNDNISENGTIQNKDIFENAKNVIDMVKKDAVTRFNLSEDNIEVKSVVPVEWTDTSLGYPESGKEIGKDYSVETIEGYVIILLSNGRLYEYHSDYYRIVPPTGYIENKIPVIKQE